MACHLKLEFPSLRRQRPCHPCPPSRMPRQPLRWHQYCLAQPLGFPTWQQWPRMQGFNENVGHSNPKSLYWSLHYKQLSYLVMLKFDMHLCSITAEVLAKFKHDQTIVLHGCGFRIWLSNNVQDMTPRSTVIPPAALRHIMAHLRSSLIINLQSWRALWPPGAMGHCRLQNKGAF